MVANDPGVVRALQKDFVCVAASDVDYANHAGDSWEVRWLKDTLSNARHGLFQGMYVVTPSGELLGQVDEGWPVYDVQHARRELARTARAYRALDPDRRLLDAAPDAERDRAFARRASGPAEGRLRLEATKRTRPFRGMESSDVRHPQHVHFDRVDVAAELLTGLVPSDAKVGSKARASRALLEAFMLESLVHTECAVWREGELTAAELSAEVTAIDGAEVELRFEGRLAAAATNQWNRGGAYDGRLGGSALWNGELGRFERFDLAVEGAYTLGDEAARGAQGARSTDVAVHVFLAPPAVDAQESDAAGDAD